MSEQKSTSERVRDIVGEVLGVNASIISEDDKLSDMGADSLDICDLYIALEDEFDVILVDDFEPVFVADCVAAVAAAQQQVAA